MKLMLNGYRGFGAAGDAEAEVLIAEVEKAYASVKVCARYGSSYPDGPVICQNSNQPFLAQLRPAIDEWKTTQRAQMQAGQLTIEKWMSNGRALAVACEKIAEIDTNASGARWDVYANAFKASVSRDVKAVADAPGKAIDKVSESLPSVEKFDKFARALPWLVGAVAGGAALIYLGPPIFRALRGLFDRSR